MGASRYIIKKAYEIKKIKNILDWVNLLTYDMHGSWEKVTGHSSAMASDIPTVPDCVGAWLEGGMPPHQIALGIATYGRSFTLASANNARLGAPSDGPGLAGRYTETQGFLSYYEVCMTSWSSKENWQLSGVGAPFASKANQWVGYETPESVEHKVKTLVNGHNLLGVAIWALDLDDFDNTFCGQGKSPIIKAANYAMAGGLLYIGPTTSQENHVDFSPMNKKQSRYRLCMANRKWKAYKIHRQKWCPLPWMCLCF